MRRRRKWLRRLGRGLGTLAIGIMLGFLVPTIIADFTTTPEVQAQVEDSPVAKAFITAYLANDKPTLDRLGVTQDMQLRAARLSTEFKRIDPPVHLGSLASNGITFHAYSTHVIKADGSGEDLIAWRVVSANGAAILVLPPSPIEPSS